MQEVGNLSSNMGILMVVFDGGFSEPLRVTTHREFMQEGTIKHGDLT